MKRPFAAFDIDGTVIRWQLYHAIADELAHQNLLDSTAYKLVKQARLDWKNRLRPTAFSEYESALVALIDQAVTGLSAEDLERASGVVIHKYRDQVYTYTRQLIASLKAKKYLLFAISASQIEIVQPIALYYGFDDCGGSRYEYQDGHFTGHKQVMTSTHKLVRLKQLATLHDADWKQSIAVGDSEGDIPMLGAVQRPIAFNPTKQLFEHAKRHNWPIVVERKNVIYQLKERAGTYELE